MFNTKFKLNFPFTLKIKIVTIGQRPITSVHNSIYIYVKTVYDM
jgi:hypothetical protein